MSDPKKIDTGTGGFPIEDAKYSYDTNPENEAYWASKKPWSSGDIDVDNSVQDVVPSVKKTLASYLSRTTLGQTPSSPSSITNAYPIKHSSDEDPRTLKITTEEGYAASLSKVPETQPHFEKSFVPGDGRGNNFDGLLRGREKIVAPRRVDGNTLLKDYTMSESKKPAVASSIGFNPPIKTVPQPTTNNPINDYYGSTKNVSQSMIYNRFNPDAKFGPFTAPGTNTQGGNPDADVLGSTNSRLQHLTSAQFEKPRQYEFGKSPSAVKVRGISYGVLAQIGVALSMRSGGELGSFSDGYNPTGGAATLAAQLPGSAQLGLDFNLKRDQLTAESVIGSLGGDSIPYNTVLIDPASMSWGTLNNINDEFSGLSSTGMQLLTAALVVTVTVGMSALFGLFSIKSKSSDPDKTPKGPNGRYTSGEYYPRYPGGKREISSIFDLISAMKGGNFWTLFGIQPTEFELEKCLLAGLMLNFGVRPAEDPKELSFGDIIKKGPDILASSAASPGYYAVLARALNRSLFNIGSEFAKLGKLIVNLFTPSADLVNSLKQFLNTIEAFRNSKFFKIANLYAQLGDKWFLNFRYNQLNSKFADLNKDVVSTNRLSDYPEYKGTDANIMSWATHRAPDYLLYPRSVAGHNKSTVEYLGIPSMSPSSTTLRNITSTKINDKSVSSIYIDGGSSARISTEIREKIEDSLESEYVPFYIQDVRTNEIVSFHAFLMSLSDSYSAQYDSVDGLGRIEPIKIYKSTARKLDFSFMLVSTNPEDFDSMWIKINKLSTLVYPQFSKGRQISASSAAGNVTAYAPFSQLVQASPLVRVRIGDLVKSNYSRFNLAKVFGYTYPDTQFGSNGMQLDTAVQRQIEEKIRLLVDNPAVDSTWTVKKFDFKYIQFPALILNQDQGFTLKSLIEREGLPPYFVIKFKELYSEGEPDFVKGIIQIDNSKNEQISKVWKILDGIEVHMIPKEDLIISEGQKKKITDEELKGKPEYSQYDKNVASFMSENSQTGNTVVKSFRSSGGKGIAGFFESLSFEWPTDKHWEIGRGAQDPKPRLGRRAPMSCKVTVGFTPIHDITPGLDHRGENRAPIYPVGPFAFDDQYSKKK